MLNILVDNINSVYWGSNISRIKINFHDEQTVIIEAITTKDVITTTLENLLYILYFILPIILVFAVIGGNFIIYKSFSPFQNILEKLKQINANDLSSRLKTTDTKDEISELINEINNLLSRLENSFEKISQFSSDASHTNKNRIHFRQGEIWFVSIGQNIGYEVYGKGENFLRPVIS